MPESSEKTSLSCKVDWTVVAVVVGRLWLLVIVILSPLLFKTLFLCFQMMEVRLGLNSVMVTEREVLSPTFTATKVTSLSLTSRDGGIAKVHKIMFVQSEWYQW